MHGVRDNSYRLPRPGLLIFPPGTLKTSVKEGGKNALEIAIDKNRPSLKEILTPVIHHGIATEDLAKLEQQTHDLMQDLAGLYVNL